MLSGLLMRDRAAILRRWIRLIIDTYPPDTASFLQREKDQFLNPVGQAITQASETIVDGLVRGVPAEELAPALDGIIRLRAVQDFAPSQAVGFVFMLKRAVREAVANSQGDRPNPDELLAFEDWVDLLALQAFDAYMRRRERIFDIKTKEIRGRTDRIMERLNRIYGDTGQPEEPDPDDPGPDSSNNQRGSA
jgi:hypothetical protein